MYIWQEYLPRVDLLHGFSDALGDLGRQVLMFTLYVEVTTMRV